ncbi:MAG: GNAT family N-acetyltransferase [Woeseiaceae bacterium]|nr:GNAT family N-acetyltransferase [Woeseiaceae bacterium]
MTLTARQATAADAAQLSHLGTAVFWDSYGGTAPDADIAAHVEKHFSTAAIAAELASPQVRYAFAMSNGDMAGLVKMREGDAPELVTASPVIEVQQLYVSTQHQRQGVGEFLVDVVRERCRSEGFAGIWLSVWSEAHWAVPFYEKVGFRSLGEIPFMLADQEYVDYLMWLPVEA